MNYRALEVIDDDRTIAVLFLVISSYTFVKSYSFSEEAAMWPRYISIIAMVGSILILAQNKLPGVLEAVIKEDSQMLDRDQDFGSEDEQSPDAVFKIENAAFTTIAIIGFGVLILTVGYLIGTIAFLIAFSLYFDIGYKMTLLFLAISFSVIYVVGINLNIPIYEGLFLMSGGIL
ncbi:tripartite tricarboxylate transporter TctB family protein [Natronorubrum sp. FCH18a]|uniref:tripartite tricarboxylate transporter TctB family protein n=1 Tax=Natronorubrum sp. FCH18a TaxID=3447018 RepID=UPI003F512422